MPTEAKKLLGNQSVGISTQVTAERLKKAGVVIAKDMSLQQRKSSSEDRLPTNVVKRLAGV